MVLVDSVEFVFHQHYSKKIATILFIQMFTVQVTLTQARKSISGYLYVFSVLQIVN